MAYCRKSWHSIGQQSRPCLYKISFNTIHVCACMCVRMCIYVYIHTHTHVSSSGCACVYIYKCVCVYPTHRQEKTHVTAHDLKCTCTSRHMLPATKTCVFIHVLSFPALTIYLSTYLRISTSHSLFLSFSLCLSRRLHLSLPLSHSLSLSLLSFCLALSLALLPALYPSIDVPVIIYLCVDLSTCRSPISRYVYLFI